MAAGNNTTPSNIKLSLRGPTYKVIVQVEGIHTWALIDFGAQVRRQMLLIIRKKKGWSIQGCHSHNRVLEQQPVGAGGKPLGAESVVVLSI